MTDPVRIHPTGTDEERLWRLVRDVGDMLADLPWLLIGGLMVRILEAEHGRASTSWTTTDVDAVLDVRAVSAATEEAARRLQEAGFEPDHAEDGVVYRFIRGDDIVDVLAPDHLSRHTRRTTVPPYQTIEALGTRQAFGRARRLLVDAGDGPFIVPLPNLIGAILLKARVAGNAHDSRAKHERDLARLLALVVDPAAEASRLNGKERAYLSERSDMTDSDHEAWTRIQGAEDGAIALTILAGGDGT